MLDGKVGVEGGRTRGREEFGRRREMGRERNGWKRRHLSTNFGSWQEKMDGV
jgi:hypothetical protein